jgi:hypothetical protein
MLVNQFGIEFQLPHSSPSDTLQIRPDSPLSEIIKIDWDRVEHIDQVLLARGFNIRYPLKMDCLKPRD